MAKTNTVRENTSTVDTKFLADVIKRNDFVDLDQALNDKIATETEKVKSDKSITDTQAKDLIEQWRKKNPLFSKDLDVKNLHLSIDNKQALYIESQYHYESRKTVAKQEPSSNQNLGDTLENLWDKPAQNEFQETTTSWKRSGSGKVSDCDTCNTTGKTTCGKCQGHGEVAHKCPNCKGKGIIDLPSVTVGKAGKVGGAVTKRTEQCLKCQASGYIKLRCDTCNGKGEVTCNQCAGKGEVFKYELIETASSVLSNNIILSPFEKAKDKWITKSKADFQITYQDPINGQNEEKLKPLNPTDEGKYLLERYNVKVLPIARVSFKFKGKEREVFIVDNEVKAVETAYLLDKKKTAILIGVIAVALIVLGIFGYNWYQNHKTEKALEANQNSIESAQCATEQANSNNIAEAKKCLDKIEINSTDLEQSTKDNINQAVITFLSKSVENNEFGQVQFVHDKFYNLAFLPESTKETIEDLVIVADISQQYQLVSTAYDLAKEPSDNDYQDVKNWENVLKLEIGTLKRLNSEFHNKELVGGLNKDQFVDLVKTSVNGYNDFILKDYLKFGSREGELKTFLDLTEQVEGVSGLDFAEIKSQIKEAIENHKKQWS
ncbi:MAG: hypothetical protein H6585_02180 [Flavobacteriales bacterium]|nr:hypothetical protein [Flavobacteriales bacterium]